jgi:hypothetical protein
MRSGPAAGAATLGLALGRRADLALVQVMHPPSVSGSAVIRSRRTCSMAPPGPMTGLVVVPSAAARSCVV